MVTNKIKQCIKKIAKIIIIDIFHVPRNCYLTQHAIAIFNYYLLGLIASRVHLLVVIKLRKLNNEGAEIGVAKGDFSELILKYTNLSKVYSIDPWKQFPKEKYEDINSVPQKVAEQRYLKVIKKLKKYKERSKVLRLTSEQASRLFTPESLDFVYIDANHKYQECKKDLELWWPKIKKKGIFAGHDYFNGKLPQGVFGVKKAVDEFIKIYNQKLNIIYGRGVREGKTWYIIK